MRQREKKVRHTNKYKLKHTHTNAMYSIDVDAKTKDKIIQTQIHLESKLFGIVSFIRGDKIVFGLVRIIQSQ